MTTYVVWGLVAAVAIGIIVYLFLGKSEEVRQIDPSKQGKGGGRGAEALKANTAKTAQLSALREKLADHAQSSAAPLKKGAAAGKPGAKSSAPAKNKSSSIPPKAVAAVTPIRVEPAVEPTEAPARQDGQESEAMEPALGTLTPTQPSRITATSPANEVSWEPIDEASPRGALEKEAEALAEANAKAEREAAEAAERAELERVVLAASEALMAPPSDIAPPAPTASGKTLILLVDDSKVVRVKTEKLLSNMGYEVATAVDGIDALAKLEGIHPDLIITDVEMPNLDGFGLVRSVRGNALTAEIPIIVMTSHVNLHLDIAATEGINGFLPKPFVDQDLLDQVAFLAQE